MLLATVAPVRAETTAPTGAPAGQDLKQVLDRLQRHYRDTNSFSAKFSEEIATVGAPKRNPVALIRGSARADRPAGR